MDVSNHMLRSSYMPMGGYRPDPNNDIVRYIITAFVIFVILALCSCRSSRSLDKEFTDISVNYGEYVEQQQHIIDSLVRVLKVQDSTIAEQTRLMQTERAVEAKDSVAVKDSVFVKEHEDGSRTEKSYHSEQRTIYLSQAETLRAYESAHNERYRIVQDSCSALHIEIDRLRDSLAMYRDSLYISQQKTVVRRQGLISCLPMLSLALPFILIGIFFKFIRNHK